MIVILCKDSLIEELIVELEELNEGNIEELIENEMESLDFGLSLALL